ncbi:abscisate beta-glucosyltransferase-like [Silene latifolia]|uniref:abscisate beta-glucosyltransferase-like n=1 Tax=Silene latifolia TaxID=37657 RepID=UPI003D76CCFB
MNTSNSNSKVKMYFFPYIAGGHLLPMIDIARFFASSHPNVQATIITTPKTALLFQSSIDHDREAGYNISFHTLDLGLPDEDENFLDTLSHDQRTKVLTAFKNLKKPLEMLLTDSRPDCFVCDLMHSWTLDIADDASVPWVVFHSTSLFLLWAEDCLTRLKPQHNVGSDEEPFLLGGSEMNDQVWFTRLRLPVWHRANNGETKDEFLPINLIKKTCKRSYAVVVNSCSDLEGEYRSAAQNAVGASRVCMVGPASLYSTRNNSDSKVQSTVKESILEWLGSKEVNSVVYVSFGSEANLSKEQFHEIAYGLEGSGQPFIWVHLRPNLFKDQSEDGWFPEGFEARIKESNQGLVIKGWAPQLVILNHVSLGAFVTHCGWNSSLEGISNGVPVITCPLTLDQFYIESFMVDVMKVGIRVGNEEWVVSNAPPKVTVTRDKLEAAVRKMMSGGEEVDEMRRKVKEYAKKCEMAIQQGGSSYQDAYSLVEELKALKEGNGKENI